MIHAFRWPLLLLVVSLLLAAPANAEMRPLTDEEMDAAPAGGVTVSPPKASTSSEGPAVVPLSLAGGRVTKTVKSFKALREEGVVLQRLDYSCGAAALSTVFTYGFQNPVKEEEVVATILVTGQTPQEGLRKYFRRKGFTLLDLKRASEARGYKGAGYRGMTVDDLAESIERDHLPVLVSIRPMGYYHFVVVRGFLGDRVLLADPAVGNVTMKISRFEDVWVDGIGFVVSRPGPTAGRTSHLLASAGETGLTSATDAASGSGPKGEVPPLLSPRPREAVPSSSQLIPLLDQSVFPPPQGMNANQIFNNAKGDRIISILALPNYNPRIQYGDPAGKFVDFSPAPGQSITSPYASSQ